MVTRAAHNGAHTVVCWPEPTRAAVATKRPPPSLPGAGKQHTHARWVDRQRFGTTTDTCFPRQHTTTKSASGGNWTKSVTSANSESPPTNSPKGRVEHPKTQQRRQAQEGEDDERGGKKGTKGAGEGGDGEGGAASATGVLKLFRPSWRSRTWVGQWDNRRHAIPTTP